MLEQIILGTVQGIGEWLPVSSEGLIILVKENFFGGNMGLEGVVRLALFLHLGTFLAALVYSRRDISLLLKTAINYRFADKEDKKVFIFLLIATIISGSLGFVLLKLFSGMEEKVDLFGRGLTALVGILLLITGFLQVWVKKNGVRQVGDIRIFDSVFLGIVQGLAVLPGLSRSGLTVSALLLRKFDDVLSLRLSFLMSLPIVLLGNIILNLKDIGFLLNNLWAVLFAFIFGILTIYLFLKLASKVNFGYFVIIFGLLVTAAVFF